MTDQSVDDYLEADRLYEPILKAMYESGLWLTRQSARQDLDKILNLGKVIGRRTALPHGITDPAAGQLWRLKTNTDTQVQVIEVSAGDVVLYRHIGCACALVGHTLTEHETRSLVRLFKEQYEPVEEYDALIEGWLKAVRGTGK